MNNDAATTANITPDTSGISSSGFYELPGAYKTGQYVGVRKYNNFNDAGTNVYFNEIKVFQTSNLLTFGGASILAATTAESNSAY